MNSFERIELSDNIIFEALYEYTSLESHYPDSTPKQIATMYNKIERGNAVFFVAKVYVYIGGAEYGTQYLGGCHYANTKQFYKAKGCYFEDMVASAKQEAIVEIEQAISELQNYLKKTIDT